MKLMIKALSKFLIGILSISALLFYSAGSLSYKNGWLFLFTLSFPVVFTGIYLLKFNPELLEKRLSSKEKEKTQKWVILLSLIMFIAIFLVCGFNFKYRWSHISFFISICCSVFFLFFYLLYWEVLRENEYLSRTIEVQQGQKVISDGLYGVVRHPMYMVTVFLFCLMPLILGCVQGFYISLLYPLILVKRIENEEEVLSRELEGYEEYKKKVKYRLLPFIY